MLFNSLDFALFLPIVFFLYWFVFQHDLKRQNLILVIASYVFYAFWDWRFLGLILLSTLIDYFIGLALAKERQAGKRSFLFAFSLITNLGLLGVFKYYNFFLENFVAAFSFFGQEITASSLTIILPVGISFYTFQTLSYSLDIYNKKLAPTRDFLSFAAFVSFFPQLVAGPIERASRLLPQMQKARDFDYAKAVDGLRQILWGLFKKIVIADNCAEYVSLIFDNTTDYSGSTLALAAFLFAFQIYGDFSGYSDIAIGTARLFGFDLMKNFAYPFFSRDVAEFWRRWHISLSSWFRDYLYIPLGGSRRGKFKSIRNIFLIFLVSGFWHGANWTFLAWGFFHALLFLPLFFRQRNRKYLDIVARGKLLPSAREFISILSTFTLTTFAWIFFRAENIEHAFYYISRLFSPTLFHIPEVFPRYTLLLILFFLSLEWIGREKAYAVADLGLNWIKPLRWSFYLSLSLLILLFSGSKQAFIYFQF